MYNPWNGNAEGLAALGGRGGTQLQLLAQTFSE